MKKTKWRARGVRAALRRTGARVSRSFSTAGPIEQSVLESKPGVYVAVLSMRGGWWKPVKAGMGGDLRDRVQTICAEEWCTRAKVRFFAIYTPRLGEKRRSELERDVAEVFGL